MKTLFPGVAVEPAACSSMPGTISFFGHDTQNPSTKLLVTCDHVIHGSDTSKNKVCSPSSGFCPTCCPSNVVGMAVKGKQDMQGNLYVDAASAQLITAEATGSNTIPGLASKDPQGKFLGGAIVGTAVAQLNERVIIFGSKTGRMEGKVTATPAKFTGNLLIEVDPDYATDVESGSGDSGAPIINMSNKLIGVMHGRAVTDLNSTSEQTRTILASHIAPILSALGVSFDPAPVPAAGPLLAPPELAQRPRIDPAEASWVSQVRGLLHDNPAASRIVDAASRHAREIIQLVNHCRPVTVAWHRGKGPAWTAHLIKSWRDPDYVIPDAIEGLTRAQLLRRMREVLTEHGSRALAIDLDQAAETVFEVAGVMRIRDVIAHAGMDAAAVTRLEHGMDTLPAPWA